MLSTQTRRILGESYTGYRIHPEVFTIMRFFQVTTFSKAHLWFEVLLNYFGIQWKTTSRLHPQDIT